MNDRERPGGRGTGPRPERPGRGGAGPRPARPGRSAAGPRPERPGRGGARQPPARPGRERRDPRRTLGAAGERLAALHLEARGFEIVDRNFRTRHGELDLVASDARFLVFCEVKTRIGLAEPGPLGPLASIGVRKRRQVRAMAREWLGAHNPARRDSGSPPEIRFDAIGLTLDNEGRLLALEHLEAAF
jgi:putative endonuclease